MKDDLYDVAILGSGIAGSMLGAILARHGAKVLLVDSSAHPRFAIGESTIPYTLVTLRTIAERYDVPEIKTLATFTNTTRVLGPSFGVKKHFGFLMHQEGKPQDPRQTNQFGTPGLLHESSHLYRQDTDSYLFHVAVKYGCAARQNCRIAGMDFDGSGVSLHGANGEEFRARYVVDASGFRSPLAEKFDLREEPTRLKHHSRSIWNHMINMPRTDALFDHAKADTPPVPWYEGTVHHMFERGWFWVIAFDNHPVSRNPMCSVGLTFDERKYPIPEGVTPEQEFYQHAARFPDVARQFEGATAMREWVRTGRLQYSSKTCAGDRFFLLSHAAGFLDPLFSRGLSNTAEAINTLAYRLLAAVRDDDFSAKRFEYVDRLQQGLFDYNDSIVNSAFISFDDYDLWNAVFRVWAWGTFAGTFRLSRALTKFLKDGNDQHFRDYEDVPNLGQYWPDHAGFETLYQDMVQQCLAYEAGTVTASQASEQIFGHLNGVDFVPKHFGFRDADRRFLQPTPRILARTMRWAAREAPDDIRKLMLSTAGEAMKGKLKGRRIF